MKMSPYSKTALDCSLKNFVNRSMQKDGFVVCETDEILSHVKKKYPEAKAMTRKEWINKVRGNNERK